MQHAPVLCGDKKIREQACQLKKKSEERHCSRMRYKGVMVVVGVPTSTDITVSTMNSIE